MGAKRRKSHICSSFPLPLSCKDEPNWLRPSFWIYDYYFFLKERNGKIPFWHFYCELIAFPLVGGMRLKVNEYRDTQWRAMTKLRRMKTMTLHRKLFYELALKKKRVFVFVSDFESNADSEKRKENIFVFFSAGGIRTWHWKLRLDHRGRRIETNPHRLRISLSLSLLFAFVPAQM